MASDDQTLLKEKLKLLETDRKAYFESSQAQLRQNKETIKALRKENKDMKSTVAAATKGGASIHDKEIMTLDKSIHEATLKLDGLRSANVEKRALMSKLREQLRDIETESQPLLTEDSYMTRKIRMLENRLDKSMIKYNEAISIKKTYEQIVKRLKEERVGFDNQLAAIERTLKAKDHDYQELLAMSHDANHAKEVAKAELQAFKTAFDEQRKQKDKELADRKAYVQAKVDQTQKLERKERLRRAQEAEEARVKSEEESGKRAGSLALPSRQETKSAEDEERLSQYEEAFKKIKDATGVSDVQEVIQKFVTQEETHRNLLAMTRDSQMRIDQLNTEKAELLAKVEELRYSGSGQLGSRRIIEEFEAHLTEARNTSSANGEKYERMAKLLISVKAGVEHLVDKLASFRSEITTPALSDENVVEVLKICEQKLQGLADEVVPSDAQEDALVVTTQMELPVHNRRVKLPNEEEEEGLEDEHELVEEQDDDTVLKRDQVKKISSNSIQRETKKLKRKRKDATK